MTRRARLKTAIIAHPMLAVVIVGSCLAAVAGASELIAREVVADKVRDESDLVADEAVIQQRGGWALSALTGQRLPEVGIASDDATLGPFKGVSLRLEVYGLRLGSSSEFESIHGLAIVDAEALIGVFKRALPAVAVTSLKMDSKQNTISMTYSVAGNSKQVELRPETSSAGEFSFVPADVNPGGATLDRLGTALDPSTGPAEALGLKVEAVAVLGDELHLILDGGVGKLRW
ncbi:hypothetical protein ABZ177_23185 [Streptomyces sp. NPDC006284]|uniref:hypothetical protein n=1 Tax=Streptomyces sp. NPDC006284 TaxID=3156742 RepID=UPI0033BCEF4F